MELWTDRLLPYFSIGINLMLCGWFVESGSGDKAVVYGAKYASAILQLLARPL
jgi:hypothetical protein